MSTMWQRHDSLLYLCVYTYRKRDQCGRCRGEWEKNIPGSFQRVKNTTSFINVIRHKTVRPKRANWTRVAYTTFFLHGIMWRARTRKTFIETRSQKKKKEKNREKIHSTTEENGRVRPRGTGVVEWRIWTRRNHPAHQEECAMLVGTFKDTGFSTCVGLFMKKQTQQKLEASVIEGTKRIVSHYTSRTTVMDKSKWTAEKK